MAAANASLGDLRTWTHHVLIAVPLQQLLYERAWTLRYTYIACLLTSLGSIETRKYNWCKMQLLLMLELLWSMVNTGCTHFTRCTQFSRSYSWQIKIGLCGKYDLPCFSMFPETCSITDYRFPVFNVVPVWAIFIVVDDRNRAQKVEVQLLSCSFRQHNVTAHGEWRYSSTHS